MNIGWMRLWDYWAGRFFCCLLSFYSIISEKNKNKSRNVESSDTILFIKLFGLGSIILSYPAVLSFKKKYPHSTVYYLTFSSNKEMIELLHLVDPGSIVTIRNDSLFHLVTDVVQIIKFFRTKKIKYTVDFEFFSRFTALFAFLTGAPYRVGFYNYNTEGLSRGRMINIPVSYNHTKHTSQVFIHLVKKLGVINTDITLPVIKGNDKIAADLKKFDKRICININSSDMISLRNWSPNLAARLVDKLLERFLNIAIIFIGTKGDKKNVGETLSYIKSSKRDQVFDFTSKTTITELIGLYNSCDVLLTVDSGPAHIAALTNISIITLFGPETPALYSPMSSRTRNIYLGLDCQPCVSVFNGKRSHCTDNICMQSITSEKILLQIEEIFKQDKK